MTEQKATIVPAWLDALDAEMKRSGRDRGVTGDLVTVMRFLALKAELQADPARAEALNAVLEGVRKTVDEFATLERHAWWAAGDEEAADD